MGYSRKLKRVSECGAVSATRVVPCGASLLVRSLENCVVAVQPPSASRGCMMVF